MSVLQSKDKKELIVTCKCGCLQSFYLLINEEWKDDDCYGFLCFMKASYDTELSPWRAFKIKAKKLWSMLRSKDYCYSDVLMTKQDFRQLKEYVDSFEV